MPSVVFTSYAQADREPYLAKFVDDFRETLGGFQGIHDKEERKKLAFFDRDIVGGEKWSNAIVSALQDARVLVCLLSHTYLRRPWCGRELQVFLERSDALHLPAGASARFIFPVWWQKPQKPRPLPRRLAELNWRDPQYPKRYDEGGIWSLYRKGKAKDYRAMADRLAELVHEALEGALQLPPGAAVADIKQIQNAFDEQQDFDARLLTLTTGGDEWQPGPTDDPLKDAAEEAARKLQIFIRPVDQAQGLAAGLNKAQAEKQIILLAVDANLPTSAALTELNSLALPNLAVLLVQSGSTKTFDDWLAATGLPPGALAKAKANGLVRVPVAGTLASEMQVLLDAAGTRLSAETPPAKAIDAAITDRAKSNEGIDLEEQPILAGPGTKKP